MHSALQEDRRSCRTVKQKIIMKNQTELTSMDIEEKKEQLIQSIAELLRQQPFEVELKVVEKPKGIKIIQEVTQEQMDALIRAAEEGRKQ